ncbi:unnamed protein product [Didymodactylos carnosus]|uniref:EGF-like domain-containing protein n=1 Tax=Didymodactylos carnosus TaxID=1234261 RepID=A0A8S2FKD7_9BILA|nr:unnamed protein product [Didymodactylos carnosus]CAF4282985.1 unnamed protein product [Didymodactylos carnosus]
MGMRFRQIYYETCSTNFCKNNGQCYPLNNNSTTNVSFSNISFWGCICQPCFTGEKCEYSNNIISLSLTSAMITDIRNAGRPSQKTAREFAFVFVTSLLVLVALANNILSLLTFLSLKDVPSDTLTKVRGNNQIYLILYSVYGLIVMSELEIRVILMLFKIESSGYQFYLCNVAPVFGAMMVHLGLWTSALFIGERMLYEIFNIQVISTTGRSIIINIIVFVLVACSHIHEIFGRRARPDPLLPGAYVCTFDYGEQYFNNIDVAFTIIHLTGPCLLHLICSILIIVRLIVTQKGANRAHIYDANQQVPHVWRHVVGEHRDFFIPPLLIILCALPHFLFAHLMVHCIEISKTDYLRLHIALNLLVYIPQTITFAIYVYPNKDYRNLYAKSVGGKFIRRVCCCKRTLQSTETRSRSDTELSMFNQVQRDNNVDENKQKR